MTAGRLIFENAVPAAPASPNRMDVACFVGYVRQRRTPDGPLAAWLDARGWTRGPYRRAQANALLDVPVPIESWQQFTEIFDRRRPPSAAGFAPSTYLAAAVRSFFAQGGRRCYVVRVGDPCSTDCARRARLERLADLLPGFSLPDYPRKLAASTPVDRASWRGVGHVFGLPDVALLCIPDLPDIVGIDPPAPEDPAEVKTPKERFAECSPDELEFGGTTESIATRNFAPRADANAYTEWARAVNHVIAILRQYAREIQLVAAVPIPERGSPADVALLDAGIGQMLQDKGQSNTGIASSFLQLAYPWVRTPGSEELPNRLEPPDGVLAGVLARNALLRGAYRSAAGLHLADVYDVFPVLSRRDLDIHSLAGRVSLLGRVPRGLTLLSDVTASGYETYRPGSVHRLISTIARAARHLGEAVTFEASNEELWVRVQSDLERLLSGLHQAGALRGATPEEAFEVRCDGTTMTQQDIDSGRVIARVQVSAAAPIEVIRITLALEDGGVVRLTPAIPQQAAA